MNTLRTGLLLSALTVLLVMIGGLAGGNHGAMTMFIIAMVINAVQYWFSDKIVLAMYGAKPLSESEAPQVYRAVREIAARIRMPLPKLYWIPTKTPNAFATGRNPKHASVAVTAGLLELMNDEELKGVLAHELSHVTNRDTLVMTIAAGIAGAIMMVARMAQWSLWMGGRNRDENRNGAGNIIVMLLVVVLAPLAAMLIQMAISRTREYGADDRGAHTIGTSAGLASALAKLEQAQRAYPLPNANPATAHLFIVNPLSGQALANLFSTHPPVAERIRRLQSMHLS